MNYWKRINDSVLKLRGLIESAIREAIDESEDKTVLLDDCCFPVYTADMSLAEMEVTSVYLEEERIRVHYILWNKSNDEVLKERDEDILAFNVAELEKIFVNLLNPED